MEVGLIMGELGRTESIRQWISFRIAYVALSRCIETDMRSQIKTTNIRSKHLNTQSSVVYLYDGQYVTSYDIFICFVVG